ncbi:MAG: RNA polymerase sigma factor [Thermoleophilaceae bacterium]|nr:RNA polymerase sigma factor [Thermoleophilaceae bacterium]
MTQPRKLDPDRLGDHIDRLYRAAWALCGSREGAEDLVQDTFARVLARPRFLRNEDDIGYLLRVLRNTFVSQVRKRRAQQVPIGDEVEVADRSGATRPDEAAEQRLVLGAIAALPQPFREAVVAVDVAGLSYAEAAKALKLPEGTLTSRVFRARRQLARALEPSRGETLGRRQ